MATVPKPAYTFISPYYIFLQFKFFYKEDVLLGHQKKGSKDVYNKKANQARAVSLLLVSKQ